MNVQEFRLQHPEYNDIQDQELAVKLHDKFYSDMPQDQFNQKFLEGSSSTTTPTTQKPLVKRLGPMTTEGQAAIGNVALDTAKDIGYSATLGHTREAIAGKSPEPGPLSLRSISPPLIALRAMGEDGKYAADIIAGVIHDATNLSVVLPLAFGTAKSIIGALSSATSLTERGAAKEALRVFVEQSKGTPETALQIQRNMKAAQELETKIPGLKFTQGQVTNDAQAISLERSLARKSGQDLSQAQREFANQSLRDYYKENVSGAGDPEAVMQQAQEVNQGLQAATKDAEDTVNSEVMRLSRTMDEQSSGSEIFERLSTNKAAMKKTATALYDKIPNVPLKSDGLDQGINEIIKTEDNIIEPRTGQMIGLIKKQIKKSAEIKPSETGVLDAQGKPIMSAGAPSEALPIGYQNLRKILSRIKTEGRAARAGATPNLQDARQLKLLEDQVSIAMDQVKDVQSPISGPGRQILRDMGVSEETISKIPSKNVVEEIKKRKIGIAEAYNKATSFYRESYVPTFRRGTVADVLQPSRRGEASKIALANIASEFDSLDGIDHLKAAVGNDAVVHQAMHDYYAMSLLNKAKNPLTGELVEKSAAQWLAQNGSKLKKLGMYDEFANTNTMTNAVASVRDYQKVFNKSVAGRIVEGDTESLVSNAFRGSKNYAATAEELLLMARGNKNAIEGIKTAIADHMIRESETTATDFFQEAGSTTGEINYTRSVAKMTKQVDEFMPALKVIYRDQPDRLRAIQDVLKAYQTLGRTARSPIGGGSDTFELFGRTLDIIAGHTAPGQWYAFKTVRDMVRKYGQQKVEKFLTQAMFDPDYAQTLTKLSKGNPNNTKAADYLMRALSTQGGQVPSNAGQEQPQR